LVATPWDGFVITRGKGGFISWSKRATRGEAKGGITTARGALNNVDRAVSFVFFNHWFLLLSMISLTSIYDDTLLVRAVCAVIARLRLLDLFSYPLGIFD